MLPVLLEGEEPEAIVPIEIVVPEMAAGSLQAIEIVIPPLLLGELGEIPVILPLEIILPPKLPGDLPIVVPIKLVLPPLLPGTKTPLPCCMIGHSCKTLGFSLHLAKLFPSCFSLRRISKWFPKNKVYHTMRLEIYS